MQQNMQLWLAPKPLQPRLMLDTGEAKDFSFVECLDGKFSYEIWALADGMQDPLLAVSVNGAELYQGVRIPTKKRGKWFLLGGVTLPKGEHRLRVRNAGSGAIQIDGFLMSRNSGYIHDGSADRHRAMLAAGEDISTLLNQAFSAGAQETAAEKAARLTRLSSMGFLYDEQQYAAEGRCRCGVPMGGVGAGKIELDADGMLTAITINNNGDVPIYRADGSFFAAHWKIQDDESGACILQKGGYLPDSIPRVAEIQFEGLFPCARLQYEGLPFRLELDAFSPLVPYDVLNSSLPAVSYRFLIENVLEKTIEVSLVFSWENILGTGGSMVNESSDPHRKTPPIFNTWNPGYTWCNRSGNHQTAWRESDAQGIHFAASQDHGNPSSFGEYVLLSTGSPEEVSFCEHWDAHTDVEAFWAKFAQNGILCGNFSTASTQDPENHASAALCRKVKLNPGEKKEILFVLSWHLPHFLDADRKDIGVYYTQNFQTARQSAIHLAHNRAVLEEATRAFESLVCASSLPQWLQHKIINDRFPIYTDSWFSKDGKFAINEAPTGMMGCLGTMDQRLACNSLYTNFFPQLDRIELGLFAEQQGENGSIPHDVGSGKFLEEPHEGTWSDLCSSFILQVYKSFIYTGDEAFLEEMYPRIKRAVDFQLSIDYDKNGIPDVGAGNGTTYDTYHWYGACAFVASLWLAELKACIRLAENRSDPDFAEKCRFLFERAQQSMIRELWKEFPYGAHFINYHDSLGENESENCFIAQLAGQWFADLMGLGDLLPSAQIHEALRTIYNRNIHFKDFTLMSDETTPEGDACGYAYTFVQYDEVYFGCLAVTRGMVKEGLECFRRIWAATNGSPWNIGLTYQTNGFFTGLPYYMTNPASLFLIDALSGWIPDAVAGRLHIAPADLQSPLELPLFSPKIWAHLSWQPGEVCSLKVINVRDGASFDSILLKKVSGIQFAEGVSGYLETTPEGVLFRAATPLQAGDRIAFHLV